MQLRCGGIFSNHVIANSLQSVVVDQLIKIGQYLAKIWTEVSWHRRGSMILQGPVSDPSERGTGCRAPKGAGSGEGAVPLARKCLYFLYQNGEFFMHSR